MAKIIVYEDDTYDLCSRYGRLTAEHDIHVRLEKQPSDYVYEDLERAGFKRQNIKIGYYSTKPEESADAYFMDGLRGSWIHVVTTLNLPKDKTVINSDDPSYERDAAEIGLGIVRTSLDATLNGIIKKAPPAHKR